MTPNALTKIVRLFYISFFYSYYWIFYKYYYTAFNNTPNLSLLTSHNF